MAGDYLLSLGCCGSQSGPLEVQGDWEHSVVPVEKEDPVLWQLRALAAVGKCPGLGTPTVHGGAVWSSAEGRGYGEVNAHGWGG
jgi:hypothetical protein